MNKISTHLLIFTLAVIIAAGCEFETLNIKQASSFEVNGPLVMIVGQPADSASKATTEHLAQILNYTKIPSHFVTAPQLQGTIEIPKSVQILCVTFSEVETFTNRQIEQILTFVSAGKTLLITTPVFEERINFLTGVKKEATDIFTASAHGFVFKTPLLPGMHPGITKLKGNFKHGGLARQVFNDDIKIIANSYDSTKTPLITKNRVGTGQTIMINSTLAYEKTYRGLLFALMLPGLEGLPYPVANVSTIFLDDFPLPLYDLKKAPIDSEYDITTEKFITDIWWPDMQALADRYKIDYTAVMAFNYNANMLPPFDFREWLHSDIAIAGQQEKGSVGLAHQVKESRHELGLHGYNHLSLWLKDWPSKEFMVSALKAARKRWHIDDLGPLPITYVPPTNNIDSVGLEAVVSAMPQIKTVSSLYLGDIKKGGGREFGPDPYDTRLYNYPRISSGFFIDERTSFDLQSLYLLSGIWTHFVHPDDVFQTGQGHNGAFVPRNKMGFGWRRSPNVDYGLYNIFEQFLARMQKTYPMIRYKSAKEAVPIVEEWNKLELKTDRSDSLSYVVKLNQQQKKSYWFMYIDNRNAGHLKAYLQNQADVYHLTPMQEGYLVQFSSRSDTLVLPNFKPQTYLKEIPNRIREQYLSFVSEREPENMQGPGSWRDTRLEDAWAAVQENPSSREMQEQLITLAVEFDRLPFAIDVLEQRLMASTIWNDEDIERLIKYYGWSGMHRRAYHVLENLWTKFKSEKIIKLKEKIVTHLGSPNKAFNVKWLMRELNFNIYNRPVFRLLLAENVTSDNWPQLKKYLRETIRQHPDSEIPYVCLIKYSLEYDEPKNTLTLLNTVTDGAIDKLKPFTEQIIQAYIKADNFAQARNWAERNENISTKQYLEWLLWENKTEVFRSEANRIMARQPDNDSLRAFIGQQLIHNGGEKEGYAHLYSLFRKNKVPQGIQMLVQNQISYQSFDQQKQFFRTYPAFFSDSLNTNLRQEYRRKLGSRAGAMYDLASDNFSHTVQRAGSFWEWRNHQNKTFRLTAEQASVSSDVSLENSNNHLWHINYRYQQSWPERGLQLTAGAGFYSFNSRLHPDVKLSLGYGKDTNYTWTEFTLQPKFTSSALQQNINELNLSLYREDYLFNRRLQPSIALVGKWLTNNVYTAEVTGQFSLFSILKKKSRLRFITELSYADASKKFTNALPYFTPDQLFVQGAGAEYRFGNLFENQPFAFRLELMGKHDRENGLYVTSSGQLKARLQQFWNISLKADISTSAVYRYNRFGVSISHVLPNKL